MDKLKKNLPTFSGRREKHIKGLYIAKKRNHRCATASSVIKNKISTVRFTRHKQSSRLQILDSVLNAFYVCLSCFHRCHSLDPAYLLREFWEFPNAFFNGKKTHSIRSINHQKSNEMFTNCYLGRNTWRSFSNVDESKIMLICSWWFSSGVQSTIIP